MSQHPRKRSRSAHLILMVPATTLLVAGCSDNTVPAVVYRDVAECTQQHPELAAQCQIDYNQARQQHAQVAPRYMSRAECEADFGYNQCEVAPYQHSGGSYFMPLMMGYLAAQMFNRPQPMIVTGGVADSIRGANGYVPAQPLYRARDDDTFRTANNEPVARRSGNVSVNPDSVRSLENGHITRSGGFGGTAARMSGSGS
ncbi:MAG TPA: DUF1190 domain-containing protein [Candidatus Acidoferrum sp.]|nr:DUF1190 domain-containing protein [Candidatus Acidoferrum sp.]